MTERGRWLGRAMISQDGGAARTGSLVHRRLPSLHAGLRALPDGVPRGAGRPASAAGACSCCGIARTSVHSPPGRWPAAATSPAPFAGSVPTSATPAPRNAPASRTSTANDAPASAAPARRNAGAWRRERLGCGPHPSAISAGARTLPVRNVRTAGERRASAETKWAYAAKHGARGGGMRRCRRRRAGSAAPAVTGSRGTGAWGRTA